MSTPSAPASATARAPGAMAALVLGVLGICLPFLGPFAIWQARTAQKVIAGSPGLKGEGMALAGLILGVLTTLWLIIFVVLTVSQGDFNVIT